MRRTDKDALMYPSLLSIVAFLNMFSSTAPLSRYNNDVDSDASPEEESDEETAQERALSALYGEVVEGTSRTDGKKRKPPANGDDDIEKLYGDKEKTKKRAKPATLTVEALTSADGLIRLPAECQKIAYRQTHKTSNKNDKIKAAASYAGSLVDTYKAFCFDLIPSLAFEDVLLKIEHLGSKKPVKDYIHQMRLYVRNQHLEKLYGKEKANQMIAAFDLDLRQQQQEQHEENGPDDPDGQPNNRSEPQPAAGTTVAPLASERCLSGSNYDDEGEQEARFDDEDNDDHPEEAKLTSESVVPEVSAAHDEEEEEDGEPVLHRRSSVPTVRRTILDDDDDDDDDDWKDLPVFATTTTTTTVAATTTTIVEMGRLVQSDCDDRNEMIGPGMSPTTEESEPSNAPTDKGPGKVMK